MNDFLLSYVCFSESKDVTISTGITYSSEYIEASLILVTLYPMSRDNSASLILKELQTEEEETKKRK